MRPTLMGSNFARCAASLTAGDFAEGHPCLSLGRVDECAAPLSGPFLSCSWAQSGRSRAASRPDPESICRFEKQRRCAGIGATRRHAQALQVSVATLTGGVEFGERRTVRRAHEPLGARRVRELPSERTCADCGETKGLEMFQRIKATKNGFYGRCRACRAKRARQRYWADPKEREAQVQRVRRNRLRRLERQSAA
jgi:hypothetical protein